MKYNFLDLFSGIGGFRLGAEWAGVPIKKCFNSDIDEYANKVYKKNFPESEQIGDITKIDFERLKNENDGEWIITGGFPCQDISKAGKKAGINGTRSGLFFEMLRAIGELRPRIVIFENVSELIVPRNFNPFLEALAEIGLNAEWESVSAAEVGARHRRERIWVVAYPSKQPRKKKTDKRGEPIIENRAKVRPDTRTSRSQSGKIPNPDSIGRHEIKHESKNIKNGETERKPRPRDRTQRKFIGWAIEPDVGRMADGVPRRVDRLRCLGNSVVPQIPEMIFKQAIESGMI